MMFFVLIDTATTEVYTLSLHDALPIWRRGRASPRGWQVVVRGGSQIQGLLSSSPRRAICLRSRRDASGRPLDRKSTRLNSSHVSISYAVFCLKKKTTT